VLVLCRCGAGVGWVGLRRGRAVDLSFLVRSAVTTLRGALGSWLLALALALRRVIGQVTLSLFITGYSQPVRQPDSLPAWPAKPQRHRFM
jgi:hypothetical protein